MFAAGGTNTIPAGVPGLETHLHDTDFIAVSIVVEAVNVSAASGVVSTADA